MKDVPVLGVSFRIGRIGLIFSKFLEKKALEKPVEIGAPVVRAVGDARPRVAVAEDLPREAPSGLDRRSDSPPKGRERRGLAERKRETRVDKSRCGNPHLLQRAKKRRQPVAVYKVVAGEKARERLGVAVDRGNVPAPPKQFGRITPFAAAEINRQRRRRALSLEVPQRRKQRVSRRLARDRRKVARPVPRLRIDVRRSRRGGSRARGSGSGGGGGCRGRGGGRVGTISAG